MTEQTLVTTKPITPKDQLRITKKFELWCNLFLDKKSETYGNATQSAIKAYKLKPKQYFTAGQIGSRNIKKVENLGLRFSEDSGISANDWWKIAAKKALNGSYEQTLDFMQRIGVAEKETNVPANQTNLQFNFGDLAEKFMQNRQARGLEIPQDQSRTNNSTGSSD